MAGRTGTGKGKWVEMICGMVRWEGKTRKAAEAERDKHLARLFADLDWEPMVIPFPGGVMTCFLNWAGNWESTIWWDGATLMERACRGCTIHSERSRQEVHFAIRRHVADIVRDREGYEAGLTYLHPQDERGREDYERIGVWRTAYQAAKAEGKSEPECDQAAEQATTVWATSRREAKHSSIEPEQLTGTAIGQNQGEGAQHE